MELTMFLLGIAACLLPAAAAIFYSRFGHVSEVDTTIARLQECLEAGPEPIPPTVWVLTNVRRVNSEINFEIIGVYSSFLSGSAAAEAYARKRPDASMGLFDCKAEL